MSAERSSLLPDVPDEGSEFGSGIVVCLAKFSEHLWNEDYESIRRVQWWSKLTDAEREKQRREAEQFPFGDAARRVQTAEGMLRVYGDAEKAVSRMIEMWMNGASDHFYDLDEERAPSPLKALASLALKIGHGFGYERLYTWEDVERIRELWKKSCLAVDEMLGAKPDWGQG